MVDPVTGPDRPLGDGACLLCGDPVPRGQVVCASCNARTAAHSLKSAAPPSSSAISSLAPETIDLVPRPDTKKCPSCAEEIKYDAVVCRYCQRDVTGPVADIGRRQQMERSALWYQEQGYRVVSRTATSMQLVKPKHFSFVFAALWFLLLGIGVVIYLFYYLAKRDATVLLTIDGPSPGDSERPYYNARLKPGVSAGCPACGRTVTVGAVARCAHCGAMLPWPTATL